MLISCALFAGATYAWFFDDNCSASVATVTAADYFGVNVVKESEPDTKMLPTSGVYHLESGTYTVTLTWVGDETTRGYYIIGIGDASNENVQYYDPKLTAETTTVSFPLVIAEQNSATLTPVWKGSEETGLEIPEEGITYPDPNAETNQAAQQKVQQAAQQEAPSESDEPKQPESGEGKENTSGEEGGSIGSGSSGPETGENAGDAKDSSEVKQPEVIPETSPAELSKDSSENQ